MRDLVMGFAGRVRRRGDDERGAVMVITALILVALFGMLVLTIDVGGLLLRRREMVNASDAAALAAAKSCADQSDSFDPESRADIYAAANVKGVAAENGGITEVVGCDDGAGYLSVEYQSQQQLFFAQVLGFGNTGTVKTKATAAWGPTAGGFAVPIVLDAGYLQGTCKVPDGIAIDDTCAFWYNNGEASLGAASWGFMNLSQWNVSSGENCHNAGSSDRRDWIINNYPDLLLLNGSPPGSAPTYVCVDTGHSASNWDTLHSQIGQVKLFPVNDCNGQLAKGGGVAPCPDTPDKYDIVGFTRLLIHEVYKGNDSAAIGTPGTSGTCTMSTTSLTNGQVKAIADSYGTSGCPSVSPDTLLSSSVHIYPKKGAEYRQCAPGDTSPTCAYWYDTAARTITWRIAAATDLKVQYGWSMNGTPGACGIRPSDPNAICLVTQWKGFTTGSGRVGEGEDFGAQSIVLCDRNLGSCPGQS
ncbi:MAG: pilus assembly protein TadG-related protein [Actinomycetota bacterium]